MSICVFTNIFTLSDKSLEENKYIDMFSIWLHFLEKNAGLKEGDIITTAFDDRTYKYISTKPEIYKLLDNCRIVTYPSPRNLKEGMAYKYSIANQLQTSFPDVTYMYLDVDVLIYKNIREIPFPKNRIYVTTEERIMSYAGNILNDNYLGLRMQLSKEQTDLLINMGGISAGLFGWHNEKKEFANFFVEILEKLVKEDKKYYTIEQPYFNEAVINIFFNKREDIHIIPSELIGINDFAQGNYVLINYAGEPGDQNLHFKKLSVAHQIMLNTQVKAVSYSYIS